MDILYSNDKNDIIFFYNETFINGEKEKESSTNGIS
jgi:hypothetical protein